MSETPREIMPIPPEEKTPFWDRKISRGVLLAAVCITLILSVLLTFAVVSGMYRDQLIEAYASSAAMGDGEEFSEISALHELFKNNSYYDIDDEEMLVAMLRAYAAATGDRYAAFYTPEEYDTLLSESNGDMVGVGIHIIENEEFHAMEVISVMPDSPALAGGVMAGDLITHVKVDGQLCALADIGYLTALDAMKGEPGSLAEFTALRRAKTGSEEWETVSFSIARAHVTVQSVSGHLCQTDPSVAVIEILQFDLPTPQQFARVMDDFIKQGVTKFVFDVRNNPGGDLLSIEAVLSYFLQEGDMIIGMRDKEGTETKDYVAPRSYAGDYEKCNVRAEDIGKYRSLDMVVLVNEHTASAAELFTSVLQDYGLADVVGVTTFGKGSVQRIYSMTLNNQTGGVKMTRCLYFPPSGECYDGIGVIPDIEMPLDEAVAHINPYRLTDAEDNQLQAAVKALNQ